MSADAHINLTIKVNNSGIARDGFGLIGILSHRPGLFSGRSKLYSQTADAITDGFPADGPEVRSMQRILSQSPHPSKVAILRADGAAVIQKYELVASPVDKQLYELIVQGEGFVDTTIDYTSGVGATAAQIHEELVDGLNAIPSKNFTASFAPLVVPDATWVGNAGNDRLTFANALVYPDTVFTATNADEIFHAAVHGLLTGDGPLRVSNAGGALPTGLLGATDYWAIRIDANTFYLATSLANALAGTHLSISTDGTGTQTISDTAETRRVVAHTLETGDGPIQVSNAGGALPAGLVAATDYWVTKIGTYTIQLATTLDRAIDGPPIDLTTDGTGVQTLSDTVNTVSPSGKVTILGNAANAWFSIETSELDLVNLKQTHSDFGVAAQLDAIKLKDNTWYWLETNFNSKDYVLAVAAWVEANRKVYVVDVNETDSIDTVVGGATDTLATLLGLQYKRTLYGFHHHPAADLSAGLEGELAPKNPGLWTAAYKPVVGVEASPLNETHMANLDARKASYYKNEFGRNFYWEGKVANPDYGFLDITVFLDWFTDDFVKSLAGVLLGLDGLGYADEDFRLLVAAGKGSLARGVSDAHKGIARGDINNPLDPPPSFMLPLVADVDPSVRSLREIPDGQLTFRLRGFGHKVSVTATVSF